MNRDRLLLTFVALGAIHCGLTEPNTAVGVDAGREAGRDGGHDAGTTTDTGALPDVAACGTPFDATMALPDSGICSGNCDHAGYGTGCCPGSVCVPCAIPAGDGSYLFNVEAGPFYCNVTMR